MSVFVSIERGFVGVATKGILPIYDAFAQAKPPRTLVVGEGWRELAELLYKYHEDSPAEILEAPMALHGGEGGRRVLVGFSGGLDSAYSAVALRDEGWRVTLFHVKGLNLAYPDEDRFARRFARAAEFDYVECAVKTSKQRFPDNPVKNQLVMSLMVDYGQGAGIYDIAMGEDWGTPIAKAKKGFTVTDAVEVNRLYIDGINKAAKIGLHFIDGRVKKISRIERLSRDGILGYVYSCIGAHRFRARLRKTNELKYGVELLPGRCGSCFKCCQEALMLAELGESLPAAYKEHCWHILAESAQSHAPEMFSLKRSVAERRKALLSYGS